jgi:hypothetical protein
MNKESEKDEYPLDMPQRDQNPFFNEVLKKRYQLPPMVQEVYIHGGLKESGISIEYSYLEDSELKEGVIIEDKEPFTFFEILVEWCDLPPYVQNFAINLCVDRVPTVEVEYIPFLVKL